MIDLTSSLRTLRGRSPSLHITLKELHSWNILTLRKKCQILRESQSDYKVIWNKMNLPEPDCVAIARNTTKVTKITQIISRRTPNHLMAE